MTGVPPLRQSEQLIGALIPASLLRQRPPPLPAVELPAPHASVAAEDRVELFACRVDPSGRILATAAAAVLDWPVGTRLRAELIGRSVVLRVDDLGRARTAGADITLRAKIGLPVAVRHLCAIEPGSVVVLATLSRTSC